MYVYRIQHHSDQSGPYLGSSKHIPRHIYDETLYNHNGSIVHPNMFSDCNTFDNDHWYACFHVAERLIDWFDHYLFMLHDHGYIVAIYQIHDLKVRNGTYQSIFIRDDAVLVDTISIPDFISMV